MLALFMFAAPQAHAAQPPAAAEPAADSAQLGSDALRVLVANAAVKESEAKLEVARAFAEIGNPSALPILRKMLKDKNAYVRVEAAFSMQALGDARGIKEIETLVLSSATRASKTPTPAEELRAIARNKLRAAAITRLAQVGGVRAVEILEQTLKDPSGAVRDATTIALAKLGFEEFTAQFVDALKSKDEGVRAQAANAIWQSGQLVGLDELRTAAEDQSPAVRAEAFRALGNVSDPIAFEHLARGLRDPNLSARAVAVQSIGRIPGPRSSQLLRSTAEDKATPSIALKAVGALARRGEKVDLALVTQALGQDDADARLQAVDIVKSLKPEQSVPLLTPCLEDGDPRVKIRSAAALVKILQTPRGKR
ncbi:MAG: HEAT repeat domain-containing protein [Elusimicrobia bacterium]|nr:HEAT repeat domain-containing protein [Elusimicrobiota bacterium]